MEVSVSNQLYVFAVMLLCGAGAGVLFDIFRALRKTFGASMLTTSVGDIVFWLCISIGLFGAVFTVNYGELRWFEIIGVILGGIIYFLSVSRLFMCMLEWVLGFVLKIFLTIFKIILTPFVFLYKMIKKPLLCAGMGAQRLFRGIGRKAGILSGGIRKNIRGFGRAVKKS